MRTTIRTRRAGLGTALVAILASSLASSLALALPTSGEPAGAAAQRPSTRTSNWVEEGGASRFSFAVIPDTQTETLNVGDSRSIQRTRWLVNRQHDLDLRFALHTGDVVNWGWLVPRQYAVESKAMRVLERHDIPYALTIGNHDTRAVGWDGQPGSTGYGGSAYAYNPECPTKLGAAKCDSHFLLRRTQDFNNVFDARRYTHVAGAFKKGRVDNYFTTYRAGGRRWLVLTLELWPRTMVINWARRVVRSHPHYNVIVQTHDYLDPSGNIEQTNGGYGANSPQHLTDTLISKFSNIRMVVSGHVGARNYRADTYRVKKHGRWVKFKVASFVNDTDSNGNNPVQIIDVDTARGAVSSTIRNPAQGGGQVGDTYRVSGLRFVR